MSINFKNLSVFFVALMAAASVMASPAAATTHDFEAEAPYIFTGAQKGKKATFKFSGGAEAVCEATSLSATVGSSPSQSLTLKPTFAGCEMGELPVVLDTPCSSNFTGETNFFGHGVVHIECTKEPVSLTVNGCVITYGEQTPEQGAQYTENKEGLIKDVEFKVTEKNIKYSKVGAACALIAGLFGELTLTGEYTATAYKDEGGAEGAQIPFTIKSTN